MSLFPKGISCIKSLSLAPFMQASNLALPSILKDHIKPRL